MEISGLQDHYPDSVEISFPDTVCLDKPFFFNLEYMSGESGSIPSLFFDTGTVDTCYQWFWSGQPAWSEWYESWDPPPPGWVVLGIGGYCGEEQTDCGEWYWKPDTATAPSGMPDFDQNQDEWTAFCGPAAVANCLWWYDAVPPGWTPPQLIDTLARYFRTDPDSGTQVDSMQAGLEQYFLDYEFALQESTFEMPDFLEMEDSLKVCQDVILLLGFWWWDDDSAKWYREGGHFVTMAGVNSEKKEIAISDPDRDQVLRYPWWPGRFRLPDHPNWGDYTPEFHNDTSYVSHDAYVCLLNPEFPSPGSELWELADYCYQPSRHLNKNVPDRFRAVTRAAPKHLEYWRTEVEAAVMICPKPDANYPPQIEQPDFLEGNVDDAVEYTITGTDPDGDSILDEASIDIQPGCGSDYSITRISGQGTSSGTWEITWYTDGCTPCDTHMVIHGLTDEHGAADYCTTWVHLVKPDSLWYWKPDTAHAPSGMPDFDQNQDDWTAHCGPAAVANCLWWYDAVPPGWTPPQLIDTLARYFQTDPDSGTQVDSMQAGLEQYFLDYEFALQESTFEMPDFLEMEDSLKNCQDIILLLGFWWYEGEPQQFIRGDLNQDAAIDPQDFAYWLMGPPFICDDAADANDDGILDSGDSIALYDYIYLSGPDLPPPFPDCGTDPTSDALDCASFAGCAGGGTWHREGGHFVTMAGVCSESLKIALSDPDRDAAVAGGSGRVRPPWHPEAGDYLPELHNDSTYVSHDMYQSLLDNPFPSPGNPFWEINYTWARGEFSGMNVPDKFKTATKAAPKEATDICVTEVEYAVMICPKPTAVEGEEGAALTPKDFELHQNFPNPFNAETLIKFNLQRPAEVTLAIYNVLGQKVRTLAKGRLRAGHHSIRWDGTDEKGNDLCTGIYFYQLKVGEVKETKRLVLLK
jgi:hypothetical protein